MKLKQYWEQVDSCVKALMLCGAVYMMLYVLISFVEFIMWEVLHS